jgi:Flp pilus assembly protein TadD
MKKSIFIVAALATSLAANAQKQNIQNANNYLRDKDYDKALEYIEKAAADPSTKDDPKTWYVRGNIYMAMQEDAKYAANSPYREAMNSYMQAQKLKPGYEKDVINQNLLVGAYKAYNEAVNLYNNKEFDKAYDAALKTVMVHNLEDGKKYASNKPFDTVASQGALIAAYSAYYGNKYENAIPMLQTLKASPIGRTPSVYLILAEVYKKQNNDAQYLATIEEARKVYPADQNIRNEELNYYIRTGKQAELIQKLEAAVQTDPNNAELNYNLANAYNSVANPKEGTKPANAAEMIAKAEAAYMTALKIEPNNAGYHYNTGVLYYNQATDINNEMNKLGNTPPEQKKYDGLLAQRDALFAKSVPYLEKAVSLLEPNVKSLTADDKFTYESSLTALSQMFARQNKMDKVAEIKAKIDAMK